MGFGTIGSGKWKIRGWTTKDGSIKFGVGKPSRKGGKTHKVKLSRPKTSKSPWTFF